MKGVAFANTPGQLSQKSYNPHAHYGESVKAYIAKHFRLPKFIFNNNYKNRKKMEKIVKLSAPDTPGSERNGLGLSDKSGKRSYKFAIFAMICSFVSYYIICVLFSNCRQSASSSTTVTIEKTFDKRAFWTRMGTDTAIRLTLANTGAWLGVATVACSASVVPICVGALMSAAVSATAVILAAGAYIYYLSTADFSSVVKSQ